MHLLDQSDMLYLCEAGMLGIIALLDLNQLQCTYRSIVFKYILKGLLKIVAMVTSHTLKTCIFLKQIFAREVKL